DRAVGTLEAAVDVLHERQVKRVTERVAHTTGLQVGEVGVEVFPVAADVVEARKTVADLHATADGPLADVRGLQRSVDLGADTRNDLVRDEVARVRAADRIEPLHDLANQFTRGNVGDRRTFVDVGDVRRA